MMPRVSEGIDREGGQTQTSLCTFHLHAQHRFIPNALYSLLPYLWLQARGDPPPLLDMGERGRLRRRRPSRLSPDLPLPSSKFQFNNTRVSRPRRLHFLHQINSQHKHHAQHGSVRPSVQLFSSEALILSVFLFLPPPPPFSILVTLTHSFLQGVSSSLVASYSWPRPSAVSALCDCVSLLFALRGFARSRRQHEEGSFKLANEWGKR